MNRISAIDFTRGLVMIIMALDHARDLLHTTSLSEDPTNMQTTTAVLFITRWITHLCAPTFVFLSGTSAYLIFKRDNNPSVTRRFLLSRGLWLLVLEYTLINFALWSDIHFRMLLMEVISVIGIGFIVLSFLIRVPARFLGAAGLLIIFAHPLLQGPALSFVFSVLFRPGLFALTPDFTFIVGYPAVPWLGILLTGFACGQLFEMPVEIRNKILVRTGLAALALFIILRFLNGYGDPAPWMAQQTKLFSVLSFMNVTKYPPSLLFVLLFLGIMMVILSQSGKIKIRVLEIVSVFGKVALFYFIVHLFIIRLLLFIMLYLQGFGPEDWQFGVLLNGRPASGSGVELGMIYLIWLGVVLSLYPLCKWYGSYKAAHKDNRLLRYI